MYETFEQLMRLKGVTAYRVAKDTGIATATLSDWKRGRSVPKQDKLQKIADYFGVSVDYILTGVTPDEKSGQPSADAVVIANSILENPLRLELFEASRHSRDSDLRLAAYVLAALQQAREEQ